MAINFTGDYYNDGILRVGRSADGTATIDGGTYTYERALAGVANVPGGVSGAITVTGDTAVLNIDDTPNPTMNGLLVIGVSNFSTTGTLNVLDGGRVQSTNYAYDGGYNNLTVGSGTNATGTVTVSGESAGGQASMLTLEGDAAGATVGVGGGAGTISVDGGGYFLALTGVFGTTNSVGTLNVDGADSYAFFSSQRSRFYGTTIDEYAGGRLTIGGTDGDGYLNVTGGGRLLIDNDVASVTDAASLIFSSGLGSYSKATVDGAGSLINVRQFGANESGDNTELVLGAGGEAHVDLDNGGQINVFGAGAALVVGRGLYDGLGKPTVSASQSRLSAYNGSLIQVNSQGYGAPYGSILAIGEYRNGNGRFTLDDSALYVTSTSDIALDDSTGQIVVGARGYGQFFVQNNSTVDARSMVVGAQGYTLNGDNSTDQIFTGYYDGADGGGSGFVRISGGSTVTLDASLGDPEQGLIVGNASGTNGTVIVTGAGSTLTSMGGYGQAIIGTAGDGTVRVESGGTLEAGVVLVGEYGTGDGTLRVTGAGSSAVISSNYGTQEYGPPGQEVNLGGVIVVGAYEGGKGYLFAENGASIEVNNAAANTYGARILFGAFYEGDVADGVSYGLITGSGTTVDVTQVGDVAQVSHAGNGGATVLVGQLDEADVTVSYGAQLNITGANALLEVGRGYAYDNIGPVAPVGASRLNVDNGAAVVVDSQGYGFDFNDPITSGAQVIVGNGVLSDGELIVAGGSTLTVTSTSDIAMDYLTGSLVVGRAGDGRLGVYEGSSVVARSLSVADLGNYYDSGSYIVVGGYSALATGGAYGRVYIDGAGSSVTITGKDNTPYDGIEIGASSGTDGAITVSNGATLTSEGGAGRIRVARNGDGVLDIESGGTVNGFFVDVGRGKGSDGRLFVEGADSSLNVNDNYGNFSFGGYAGEAGFLRAGRNDGSSGRIYVRDGGQINVSNAPGSAYDNPFFQVGRNNGSYGYFVIEGSGTPSGGGTQNSAINVTQTGPVGDYVGAGQIGPFGPGVSIGQGGQGVGVVRNGGELNVTGAAARLQVGRGRDNDNTALESQLRIYDGGQVVVDSLGYGGDVTFDPGGPYETTNNLGGQISIASQAGVTASISVEGAGSLLKVTSTATEAGDYNNGRILVGHNGGAGELDVTMSAEVEGRNLFVGVDNGSTGDVYIASGGAVTITSNSATPYQGVRVGANGGDGYLTVTGAGSTLTTTGGQTAGVREGGSGLLRIGQDANSYGRVDVLNGGEINAFFVDIGRNGGEGRMLVDGVGSTFNVSNEFGTFDPGTYGPQGGQLRIGGRTEAGTYGKLGVYNGGTVLVSNRPTGPAAVQGDGAILEVGRANGGEGRIQIQGNNQTGDRSTVTVRTYGPNNDAYNPPEYFGPILRLARGGDGDGTRDLAALINVVGSDLNVIGDGAFVSVGDGRDAVGGGVADEGRLNIFSGGVIKVDSRGEGAYAGQYQTAASVVVGNTADGYGRMYIDGNGNGASLRIYSDNVDNVDDTPPSSSATFPNTAFGANFTVGDEGFGRVLVSRGGDVQIDGADDALPSLLIGRGTAGTGILTVEDAGSNITITGTNASTPDGNYGTAGLIAVGAGYNSYGVLRIYTGGVVSNAANNATTIIGGDEDFAEGTVRVDGTGATLNAGDFLAIGAGFDFTTGLFSASSAGEGELLVKDGGLVTAGTALVGLTGMIAFDDGAFTANLLEVSGELSMQQAGVEQGRTNATVNGDFTFTSSATTTFDIEDNIAGDEDFLDVNGDATIASSGFTIDIGAGFADAMIGDEVAFLRATNITVDNLFGFTFTGTAAPVGTDFLVLERAGSGYEELVVFVREVFDNRISIADAQVLEGDEGDANQLMFMLTRTGDLSETITVDFDTAPYGANPASTTDLVGGIFPTGQVTFGVGNANAYIYVDVDGGGIEEPDETLSVTLSNIQTTLLDGATFDDNLAIGTILNDDYAPIAQDDIITTDENTPLLVDLTADNGNGADIDPDAQLLTITRIDGVAVMVGDAVTLASGATVVLDSATTVIYDPTASAGFDALDDAEDAADAFTYEITDEGGNSDTANVNVTVDGVNDPPVAQDDDVQTDEDTILTGDLFANNGFGVDFDVEGDVLSISSLVVDGNVEAVDTAITLLSGAILTVNSDGTFTFDPNGAFEDLNNGDIANQPFTYTLETPDEQSDQANVNIEVNGVGDAPTPQDDGFATDEDTPVVGDLFADNDNGADSDPEEDAFSVTQINGAAVASGSTITLPSGARLTINANGTFTYDPSGAFDALDDGDLDFDNFTYTVQDATGLTGVATASFDIDGLQDAPTAVPDVFAVDEDVILSGALFANNGSGPDFDAEGDPFTVVSVNDQPMSVGVPFLLPSGATVTVNANGTFTYNQNGLFEDLEDGETDQDTFQYRIQSPDGLNSAAQVTINIDGDTDTIILDDGDNVFLGGADDDRIDARGGNDFISGRGGADEIFGGAGNDVLRGGIGNDTLNGGAGRDRLFGEGGDDVLLGGTGDDRLIGRAGNDFLQGDAGNDLLAGGGGDDTLLGGDGMDTLKGGGGNDSLDGGADADILKGGGGNDTMDGGSGNDRAFGGRGDDLIRGGAGNDRIAGRKDNDFLLGDAGADRFLFNRGDGNDTIGDFEVNIDKIVLGRGAESLADVTITNVDGEARIAFADVTIRLEGVAAGQLDADDFIF